MKKILILLIVFLFSGNVLALETYITDPITDDRIYENTDLSQYNGNTIQLRTCPGEYIPGTFTLNSPTYKSGVTFDINFPFDLDLKVIKRWYQRGDDTHADMSEKLYVPELMLNDEDLIKVTYQSLTVGTNELRDTSGTYHPISAPGESTWDIPVRDADTLQPVELNANKNKQFWITIYVNEGQEPGDYSGTIDIMSGTEILDIIKIELEVLPFTLPESSVEPNIYFSNYLSSYSIGHRGRSAQQLRAEYENLKAHGVRHPSIGTWWDSSSFNAQMDIYDDVYSNFSRVYWQTPVLMGDRYPQDSSVFGDVLDYFQTNYGTEELFFYTEDETDTVPQAQGIAEMRSYGAKTYCAQSTTTILTAMNHDPPLLDLAILHSEPIQSISDYVRNKGCEIGSYANPQAGEEKPHTYRRNFGLLLWQNNVDVSMTFAYNYGYDNLYNDWNWNSYKQHVMAYPTENGVIDTIQWEGWHEGVNDIRYLNYLENISDYRANVFLNNLKTDDLEDCGEIRDEIINHIMRIEHPSLNVPGFEILFLLIGFIFIIWRRKK